MSEQRILKQSGSIQVIGREMRGDDKYVENIYLKQFFPNGQVLNISPTSLDRGSRWGLDTVTVWVVDAVGDLPAKAFQSSQEAAECVFERRHQFIERFHNV